MIITTKVIWSQAKISVKVSTSFIEIKFHHLAILKWEGTGRSAYRHVLCQVCQYLLYPNEASRYPTSSRVSYPVWILYSQ